MSRTERRNWRGETVRDGHHGKRCPSTYCDWCSESRERVKDPLGRKKSIKDQLEFSGTDEQYTVQAGS